MTDRDTRSSDTQTSTALTYRSGGGASREERTIEIHPGSWWRLVDDAHDLAACPAPDHGLILLVEEVRVVDDEIHTIKLHPHPAWRGVRAKTLLLVEDFLRAFVPEPNGAELRETELSDVMGRVSRISDDMRTPPDPALLLEAARNQAPRSDETNGDKAGKDAKTSDETRGHAARGGASTPATSDAGMSSRVPAALLPSGDVVEAQARVETRIAELEAQKNWVSAKTEELRAEMSVVSAYQSEKVAATTASISQEVDRANALLQNVQTMRLFLGEDVTVEPLLDGEGADPAEPLTLMQRMLFLDEEILVDGVFEGVSAEQEIGRAHV